MICNRCNKVNPPEIHTCFASREYLCAKEEECEKLVNMLKRCLTFIDLVHLDRKGLSKTPQDIQEWWDANIENG